MPNNFSRCRAGEHEGGSTGPENVIRRTSLCAGTKEICSRKALAGVGAAASRDSSAEARNPAFDSTGAKFRLPLLLSFGLFEIRPEWRRASRRSRARSQPDEASRPIDHGITISRASTRPLTTNPATLQKDPPQNTRQTKSGDRSFTSLFPFAAEGPLWLRTFQNFSRPINCRAGCLAPKESSGSRKVSGAMCSTWAGIPRFSIDDSDCPW